MAMEGRGVILIENSVIKINNEKMCNFLSSLIWPMVESYWLACVYMFTIKDNNKHVVMYN